MLSTDNPLFIKKCGKLFQLFYLLILSKYVESIMIYPHTYEHLWISTHVRVYNH